MAVDNQTKKVIATGNGAAFTFSFSPMVVFAASELVVVTTVIATSVETVRTQGVGSTNWSTAIQEFPATGSITYPADQGTALPATETITIKRVLVLEQGTNLNNRGGYFSETQEDQFDRGVMIALQQQEVLDRSITMPVSTASAFDPELNGTPAANPGKLIGVSADGLGIEFFATLPSTVSVTAYMETLLDDATAGAALTTLGITAFMQTMLDDATAGAALTTLGITAFMQTLLDDTTAKAARATLGVGGLPARKASDKTIGGSSTLEDDADLFATLAANEIVHFDAYIRYKGPTTKDIRIGFTVPSGATLGFGPAGNIRTDISDAIAIAGEQTTSLSLGTATTFRLIHLTGFVINGSNAGNLQLQWAQEVADASVTTVGKESRLFVWRV